MAIPSQPGNLFTQPFANQGTYKVLTDAKPASGRASLSEGFPTENQLPLAHGGIAPNRMDLNGILNMITAFSFWQQSGGQWTWKNTLNYAVPSVVCHNNILWWCVAASGPETGAGAKQPGTDERYWKELLAQLFDNGSLTLKSGIPVGTIFIYHGATPPAGYLACDGSSFSASAYPELYELLGKAATPDMRGLFVRGYDPTGVNDANGQGRALGMRQEDAIRNITGQLQAVDNFPTGEFLGDSSIQTTGAFTLSNFVYTMGIQNTGAWSMNRPKRLEFNASKVVPTANENRPKNISLLYCIKHDE